MDRKGDQGVVMWFGVGIAPKPGSRIVALYTDGSGARPILVSDDGECLDGEDGSAIEGGLIEFGVWAYLPDDFRLWFEDHNE